MLGAWCEKKRSHGLAYICVSASTVKERIKHRHTHDTERIRGMCTKIGCQRSQGWCGRTMGMRASLAPPPRYTCMQVILGYAGVRLGFISISV